jgi:uncharacterized membrane protein
MHDFLAQTTASQRLLAGVCLGVAVAALPLPGGWQLRGLLGWCAGVGLYLALAWLLCHRFDAQATRARAQAQDEPSVVVFSLLMLTNAACVGAIALLLQQTKTLSGLAHGLHTALAVLSLGMSWLFIQTIFSFHYAHLYYREEKRAEPDGPGLIFPGGLDPDYFDFLYYAFVVGMTSQVSDVQVTSREMRRLTLIHGVMSFAFNLLIVALSINVVASSLS